MSEHVTLLHDLDAGKNCSGEAAAAIRDLEQRIDEQREKVATWIMSLGLSTGHGDTLEDLLKEAHWQVREYQQRIATLEAACEASARWYKFHKRGFPIATPQAEELMVHYLRAAGYLKDGGI